MQAAMKIPRFFAGVTAIALVTSCATPNSMTSKLSPKAKVERFMEKAIAEEHFSGVVMVVRQGEVISNRGYGMATEKDENKHDTIIHVASVTKQFTAAAIMLLNEAGKIDLATSINHYLPKKYQSDKWGSVTVHHLLSHTGGVSDYAEQRPYYDVRKGFCFGSTVDGMLHEAQAKELEFIPGSEFRYSNIGYTLLGVIIEQVSGRPYGEFIKQKLLIPAKMFSSGIHEESYRWKQGEAKGYRWDEGQQKLVDDDVISLPVTAPDGGLFTTAEDLFKWSQVIAGKTKGILSPEIINKMTTVVKTSSPSHGPWAQYGKNGNGYGYGLFIDKFPRVRFHHPGYIVGFRSHVSLFPQEEVFIAVLSNNTQANPTRIANGIAKIMLEDIEGNDSSERAQNEIETNIRIPVVIKNRPPKKHSLLERMKHHETPGVSVAVIEHGKIAWSKGYGLLENGKSKEVDTETIFQAASMSKPLTALGILSLVKSGRIKLDANVNDYLVSWKVPENPFTKNEKVTIRRLLSHAAGLTDGNGFSGYQTGAALPTLVEILNGASPKANSNPVIVGTVPGSFFRYSGGGYEILQLLIEDITHQPFEKFMKETILAPLQMNHSTFEYPLPGNLASDAASAHNRNEVVKGKWHIYPEKAAAALWTTPTDMAKMITSVHRCAQGIDEQKGLSQILGPKLCQEMLQAHKWPLQNGRTRTMGLGFMMDDDGETKTFRHGGSNEGIICNFRGIASSRDLHGTVIMTNSSRGGHVVGELEKTIDDVYGWQAYKPIEREITDIEFELIKKRVGTSYVGPRFTVSVIEREGHLALVDSRDSPPDPIDIFPESENLFFDLEGGKHEFTDGEYLWTPPGGDERVRFKKL